MESNIVNFSSNTLFYRLCKLILKSEKYSEEIDAESLTFRKTRITKMCTNVELLISREPLQICPIKACICYCVLPKTRQKTAEFSIAAVKDSSSVILVKHVSGFTIDRPNLHILKEYLEDIDFKYLDNYDIY